MDYLSYLNGAYLYEENCRLSKLRYSIIYFQAAPAVTEFLGSNFRQKLEDNIAPLSLTFCRIYPNKTILWPCHSAAGLAVRNTAITSKMVCIA
jgi:hypothetical protein